MLDGDSTKEKFKAQSGHRVSEREFTLCAGGHQESNTL